MSKSAVIIGLIKKGMFVRPTELGEINLGCSVCQPYIPFDVWTHLK